MLLVAVTGPVGAGKSTALAHLSTTAQAQGRRVDGFVAEAEGRDEAGRGAARYVLRFVAPARISPSSNEEGVGGGSASQSARGFPHLTSVPVVGAESAPERTNHPPAPSSFEEGEEERVVYAVRDASATPPYRFDPAAETRLAAWAQALTPGLALVVLDEFGRREAAGQGLVALWPSVAAAAPAVAVLSVRADALAAIEQQLGRRFDVVVEAGTPRTDARLAALLVAHDDWARIGRYGALGGGVEVGLGSALHAGQVPARGLVLSTLQALVLLAAGRGLARRTRLAWLPLVTAGLKALSPAGNRLRPMLAITVQGWLFSAVTTLLGWNSAGLFVAGACCGAWAAAQGLALSALLVGPASILAAYETAAAWIGQTLGVMPPSLAGAATLWALAWGAVSGGVTLAAWRRLPEGRLDTYLHRRAATLRLSAPASSATGGAWGRTLATLRELARPAFWLPVVLVALLVRVAGGTWAGAAWTLLRALAVGFVLFALARRVRIDRLTAWLRARGAWGPAVALEEARKGTKGEGG